MSKPGNTRRFGYITGETAVDINRMTWTQSSSFTAGIPLSYHKGRPSTHYEAVDQGVVPLDEVYYDLDRMEPWDRFGIGWSLLAGHAAIRAHHGKCKKGECGVADSAWLEADNDTRDAYVMVTDTWRLPAGATVTVYRQHLDPEYHQTHYNLDG